MKIGIIFFGLPRSSSTTTPSIKKYIFDELRNHELIVESCFSYQTAVNNTHSNESSRLDASNYAFFKKFSHQFINPKKLLDLDLYNAIIKHGDKWKDDGTSLKHLLMQLNCIQKAYLNCKKHDCDFYIFIRPDILIQDVIPINNFISRYEKEKAILLPSWQWYKGANDRFAIATRTAADTYGLRYNGCLQYCTSKNKPLHSESFLYDCLKKEEITLKTTKAKMIRIRVNGKHQPEKFSVVRRMGGFKKAIYVQTRQMHTTDMVIGLFKVFAYYLCKPFKTKINL